MFAVNIFRFVIANMDVVIISYAGTCYLSYVTVLLCCYLQGERRLDEISRLTTATAQLIANFEDPWEELTLRNVGNQGRIFNAVEDRFLLCLTHLHGYGNWEQVRNSVRRCERFRFDFYLQACSTDVLGKRCAFLISLFLLPSTFPLHSLCTVSSHSPSSLH